MEKKLIIKGHQKNPFVKFWNWGWNVYYKNVDFWNYVIVGLIVTIFNIVFKFILLKTIFDQTNALELQCEEIINWIASVLLAYVLNRLFVFKSKDKSILKELGKFSLGRVGTQILQMLILFIFVSCLKLDTDMWVLIFTLICQVMQTLLNYFISKLIVFKKR